MTLDPKQNCTVVQHVMYYIFVSSVQWNPIFSTSPRETKIGLKIQVLVKEIRCKYKVFD